MKNKAEQKEKKPEKVRVSKKDRPKLKGQTNWAFLITEERKAEKLK